MVLTEVMHRTALWKVLRWSIFRGLSRVSQSFLVVLREFKKPEQEFLSSFFFDDVQLVVVPQSTGHLLIGHIVSVLVVSPKTCQSIGVDHPEHQAVLVLPADVFLVTIIAQKLVHVIPQQPALWKTAVGFVQRGPWLLSVGQVERLRRDALCLGRTLNL